jgi:hypothetical protein
VAGLFGIQTTEGISEDLLNVGAVALPVFGALFARSRVTARKRRKPL